MKASSAAIQPLKDAYASAIDFLYPPRCPICDCVIKSDVLSCDRCRFKVKYVTQPYCMKCGKNLEFDEEQLCNDCQRRKHVFDQGVAAFAYNDEIKDSMYRFKYYNRREYASFFAESIVKLKGNTIRLWAPDVIIPVPLHKSRQAQRGYNQAGLIAQELGKLTGIAVDEKVLYRSKNTVPQKELDDKARAKNINSAFQIDTFDVKYRKVLLVDDIFTTGSTIDECARTLIKAGANKVYFACVCIGGNV